VFRAAESVCYRLNVARTEAIQPLGDDYDPLLLYDNRIGPRLRANATARCGKRVGDRILYDVVYETDLAERRATLNAAGATPRRFAAFFGGSYTFGEGLPTDATLASSFARSSTSWAAYNYGCPGYGPQNVYVQLGERELPNEIPQSNGVAVYTFIPHHVRRAIGSMVVTTKWGRTFPYFTYRDDGRLKRDGTFGTDHPWRHWYRWLYNFETVRYAGIDLPLWLGASDFELTGALVAGARDRFLAQYPDGAFIVLVPPHDPAETAVVRRALESFEAFDLECLDATALYPFAAPQYRIPFDGHPTAAANDALAEFLQRHLHSKAVPIDNETGRRPVSRQSSG